MNELTLVRFIQAMRVHELTPTNKLYIDLMVEEIEGFLEYPRLAAYFEKYTPQAYAELKDALANQQTLTLNTTPFKALTAIEPNGSVDVPRRVLFFYVDGDNMVAERVNWIGEELTTENWVVGDVGNAWKEENHQTFPYEEIPMTYLFPVYLDKAAPGKTAELTALLCQQTAEVVMSTAGKAWCDRSKAGDYWLLCGYKKFKE
ncbi:hypothetical protein G173_gp109 [Erwinia phage phiEaH2]|uniref:Uncharacterized protein n=1 Tax=Erwinia phage phiEaH2 TaxID=1029988 RepID=J7KE11_9CAUD|nr:hypothetical protein G173_gp109 [Erwinia phage phiEaH2]AFQ96654.1 hypothetical protein [Erwinia phage phiEaH2]